MPKRRSPTSTAGRAKGSAPAACPTVSFPGGAKPAVLHAADFGERILATPALVGKNLYLRTQTKLYAFEE